MANIDIIDLDMDGVDFDAAHAELLTLKLDHPTTRADATSRHRAIASWGNFIDDCVRALQRRSQEQAEQIETIIASGGDFLPLDGSEPMTGNLDLDGNDIDNAANIQAVGGVSVGSLQVNGSATITTISTFAATILDDANGGAAMSTLGISSFAQTILDDTSGGAVMTTLGITAAAQSILDDTTVAAIRTTLGSTTVGDAVFVAANAGAARTALALGTAATSATGDFEAAGAVATHAAITSGVHGISSFAATLLDDTTAGGFMTTLGITAAAQSILDDTTTAAILTTLGISSFAQTILDDTSGGAVMSTLGISSFAQTILDDTTAGAVLTTLGVSAFVQTIFDDADAAAVRATIGAAASGAAGSAAIITLACSATPQTVSESGQPSYTDILAYTIPGGTIAAGNVVRVVMGGTYLNNSGTARVPSMRIVLGGTTLFEDGWQSSNASAAATVWRLEFYLSAESLTVVHINGDIFQTGVTAPTTGLGDLASSLRMNAIINTAVGGVTVSTLASNRLLSVDVQHPISTATQTLIRNYYTVERLAA